jgi:DNA polymerase-3 subunit beta
MKITVEKDELQKRLSNIQNIVEKKNTMPILNHFLLDVHSEDGNYITATDLETAFMEPIIADIAEEGRMCIPTRKLFEIVKEMEGQITLETPDGRWLKIKSGKSLFRLACLSAGEFPAWPSFESTEEIELSHSLLLEMIDRSLYAAGELDPRYVLNSLVFHIKPVETGCSITVVGADGYRLAISEKITGSRLNEEKRMIVSRKSAVELRRFLNDESKTIKMLLGKNHILFKIGEVQFLTRLIEGTYPDYEQVIPTSNEKVLIAGRDALSQSLRMVSIMSKEVGSAVKIDISTNNMVISASSPDIGDANDEVAVDYSGEAMTIAFNARYLLDALNAMASEKVILRLDEPLSPTLIMEEGNKDYKCVVMPMRL